MYHSCLLKHTLHFSLTYVAARLKISVLDCFFVKNIPSKTLLQKVTVYTFAVAMVSGLTQKVVLLNSCHLIVLMMSLIAPFPVFLSSTQSGTAKVSVNVSICKFTHPYFASFRIVNYRTIL